MNRCGRKLRCSKGSCRHLRQRTMPAEKGCRSAPASPQWSGTGDHGAIPVRTSHDRESLFARLYSKNCSNSPAHFARRKSLVRPVHETGASHLTKQSPHFRCSVRSNDSGRASRARRVRCPPDRSECCPGSGTANPRRPRGRRGLSATSHRSARATGGNRLP